MNEPAVQLSEHPPALSESYHKARRSYVLASALLIAWELIGFEVNEVPLENINITIKSPQAIPAVLLVLIGYFAVRLVQEWGQCNVERRRNGWALSDFASANVIAVGAIGIYIAQRLLKIQIADVLSLEGLSAMLWFFLSTMMVGPLVRDWETHPRIIRVSYVAVSFVVSIFMILFMVEWSANSIMLYLVVPMIIGSTGALLILAPTFFRMHRQWRSGK